MRGWILGILALALVAGCGKDISTPFSPAKLVEYFGTPPASALKDPKSFCNKGTDGKYVEETVIDSQGHSTFDFAQGGGCVLRSLTTTWAASRAREAFHWDRSDLEELKTLADSSVAFKFASSHAAGPSIFRQHWTIEWNHHVVDGTVDAPKRVLIQFQKVQGTSHIRHWAGAVTLEEVTSGVTTVSMRNEIDATQTGVDEAVGTVRDFIAKLRTL